MAEYQDGVSIITCTGDRPWCFERCARYVGRMILAREEESEHQWILVNDGYCGTKGTWAPWPVEGGSVPENLEDVLRVERNAEGSWKCIMAIAKPRPAWTPGQNTLARNILAAIPHVIYDKVVFIEDDDWYAPDYVERMVQLLAGRDLVGDPLSKYYHVPSRRWRLMKNEYSASLCQTGMRASMLPLLAEICQNGPNFIDARLWRRARNRYLGDWGGVVGLKGLPGRPGIGMGHRPDTQPGWEADPDLVKLREWLGEDIALYKEFL